MKCVAGEVHLWRIELDGAARESVAVVNSLTAEERSRAARLRTDELRQRWATARGAMRCILAGYVGCEPIEVKLELEAKGKPRLAGADCGISFNLSHSGGLAMLAVAGGARVGVDVEMVRPGVEVEELSRRYFHADERREILELEGEERLEAFFRCWSRKEAYVKALGGGLGVGLSSFRVSVGRGEARLYEGDGNATEGWTLLDVSVAGATAAVAVEKVGVVLRRIAFGAK